MAVSIMCLGRIAIEGKILMMRRIFVLLLIAVISTGLAEACHALPTKKNLSWEEWMGAYDNFKKVGYKHITVSMDKLGGKDVYREEVNAFFLHSDGKQDAEVDASSVMFADMDFAPISGTLTVCHKSRDLADQHINIEYTYNAYTMECSVTANGETKKNTYLTPKRESLIKACMYELRAMIPNPGERLPQLLILPRLWPWSEDYHIHGGGETCDAVAGKYEDIVANRRHYHALPLKTSLGTEWVDDRGQIVKYMPVGSDEVWVPESREQAIKDISRIPDDLQDAVASINVVHSDRDLMDLLFMKELNIRLIGPVGKDMVKNDPQQSAEFHPDKGMVEYHITSRGFDPAKSLLLPVRDKAYAKWIEESPGIECSNQEIRDLASKIVGGEHSAYFAACKLRAWVYDNMEQKEDASIPVSAVEALRAKAGACKQHAVLFAALARSVGIPTRLACGLAYAGDRSFRLHAWAECYVGEWVTFDPSFNCDFFAPATHIKMGEGNSENVADYERAWDKAVCATFEPFRIEKISGTYLNVCRLFHGHTSPEMFVLSSGNCIVPFRKGNLVKALALLPKKVAGYERRCLLCPDGIIFDFPADYMPTEDICKLHGDSTLLTLIVIEKDGSFKRYPHGIKPGAPQKAKSVTAHLLPPPGFDTYPTVDGPIFYPKGYSIRPTSRGPAVLLPGESLPATDGK
jgi:hypothetical protein